MAPVPPVTNTFMLLRSSPYAVFTTFYRNLGLCSFLEVSNLCIERSLEGGSRGAAFDIRGEALIARDDVGVLQDSQHGRHHQIAGGEAVTIEIRLVAERFGEGGEALLHELHSAGAASFAHSSFG